MYAMEVDVEMGSPLRVMVLGPWLLIICGMENSARMGPTILIHARPTMAFASSTRKIKNENLKGVHWSRTSKSG